MSRAKSITSYVKLEEPPPQPPPEIRLVIPASEKAGVLKTLTDIRALFGSKGQYWQQVSEHDTFGPGDAHPVTSEAVTKEFDAFCLIGGVKHIDGRYEQAARAAIAMAIAEETDRLNNLTVEDDYYNDGEQASEVYNAITDDDQIITTFNDDNDWDAVNGILKHARQLVKSAATK